MSGGNEGDDAHQPKFDELISLRKAAELSGLSYSHLRRLARLGEIWTIKPSISWLTTIEAVNEYLARDIRPGPKPNHETGREE